jgi:hypothetical protein
MEVSTAGSKIVPIPVDDQAALMRAGFLPISAVRVAHPGQWAKKRSDGRILQSIVAFYDPRNMTISYRMGLSPKFLTAQTLLTWLAVEDSKEAQGLVRLRLTNEASEERNLFTAIYGYASCTCFMGCTPCGWCTHPGNPQNQDDDSCWEVG